MSTSGANLKGRVDLDVSGATNALKAAQKAFRDLSSASTASGKQMTQSQRAAANAIIADYDKLRKSQSKVVDSAIAMERKLTEAARKGAAERVALRAATANSTAMTAATVGLTNQKTANLAALGTGQVAGLAANTNRTNVLATTIRETAASRLLTEELRRQVTLRDEAARRTNEGLRNELALRRQVLREQQAMNTAQASAGLTMSSMRYALYDVSSSFRTMGVFAVGAATGVLGLGVAWQKSFADVIRTTQVSGKEIGFLKAQFSNLVETLPVSWEKLTEIGTLAGQLGVAKQNITGFVKTTAQFSATTDVAVGAAATAFGRLNSILPDVNNNYEGLANAILKVGINSVATESQIIKISTQIASIAAPVGYTYQQIVGLSGALASVAVQPELARGVITRTFGRIGAAVSESGIMLEKFGAASGMSGEAFKEAWGKDASGTFARFVGTLAASGANADSILTQLGITSVRDKPILTRLGGAADKTGERFDVLTGKGGLLIQSLDDAANSSGELQKQYAIISGTAGAKLQVMFQNIQSALEKIGSTQLGGLGSIIDQITTGMRRFTESLDENVKLFDIWDLGKTNGELFGTGIVITAVIGGLALLIAGFGQVAAGGLAMGAVVGKVTAHFAANAAAATLNANAVRAAAAAGTSFAVGTSGVVTPLAAAAGATGRFSGAMSKLGGVLGRIGPTLGLIAAFVGAAALINMADQAKTLGSSVESVSNAFITAKTSAELLSSIKINTGNDLDGNKIVSFTKNLTEFSAGLDRVSGTGFWNDFGKKNDDVFAGVAKTSKGFNNFTQGLDKLDAGYAAMVAAGNDKKAAQGMQDLIKNANLTDAQLDTLISRMPEYSRSLTNGLNGREMADTAANLRDLARGTLPAVQDALIATAGIMDGVVDEAFNGIDDEALKFMTTINDSLVASLDMSSAYSSAIETANAKAKVAWVAGGNAVADFKDVAVASLEDYMNVVDQRIAAAAEKGKNLAIITLKGGSELASAAAALPDEVIKQVAAAATAGSAEFDRWKAQVEATSVSATTMIAANITNATPANIAAFAALGGGSMDAFIAAITKGDRTVAQILDDLRAEQASRKLLIRSDVVTEDASRTLDRFRINEGGKGISIPVTYQPQNPYILRPSVGIMAPMPSGATGGAFDGGGYTGNGDMYQPAGVVHKGEFVMTKKATTALGPKFLYDLMSRAGNNGYVSGGAVVKSSTSYVPSFGGNSAANRNAGRNNTMMVELSPFDRALLKANGNIGLNIDGREITNTANNGSLTATRRGSN